MSYNPTTIANYFIKKYAKRGNLTPMKIIKLTYISYGWYLALNDKEARLIDELPAAWDFGPVFPSLLESLKGYARTVIKSKLPNLIGDEVISNDDKKFLDRMWNRYGRFDGIYLSAITLTAGTPWQKVYVEGLHCAISDDDIFKYYSEKLKPQIKA